MDSTMKNSSSVLDNSSSDGEWTMVVSRHARGNSKPRTGRQEEKGQSQRPKDLKFHPERQNPRPFFRQEVRRTPNPTKGSAPNPTKGYAPNPTKGSAPNGGSAPNPTNGSAPKPTNGSAPNVSAPKPNNGSAPNPRQARREEPLWTPRDDEYSPERQATLLQKMECSIWKIRRSKFYTTFFDQLKSPEVSQQFRLLLGSEPQLPIVIYGLGSLEQHRPASKIQLSIALSMKREFKWIGEIQVFDPNLSDTECSVLETLGCTVLPVNEHARREAVKPTLFFMPRRNVIMYRNLLQANWSNGGLSKMVLLGNSFKNYKEESWFRPQDCHAFQKIVDARGRITREFAVESASDDLGAFEGLSWHFFRPGVDSNTDLSVTDYDIFPPLMK